MQLGVLPAQIPRCAAARAAGARHADQYIHLAARILPDLRAGGAVVGFGVGGVGHLIVKVCPGALAVGGDLR